MDKNQEGLKLIEISDEESKLDPPVVSGHSTFKAEGGLFHTSIPPSATHKKNT